HPGVAGRMARHAQRIWVEQIDDVAPDGIDRVDRVVLRIAVEIQAPGFADGITAQPAADAWGVVAFSEIKPPGLVILVFGREPKRVLSCHRSAGAEKVAER